MKPKTHSKKLLIFDFDGTIVDSKEVYYKEIFKVMKPLGYKYHEVDKAIDFGLSLKKTLRNFGLSWIMTIFFKRKIMKKVKEQANQIKKCEDVDSIKNLKHEKILVSNSLNSFIKPILKHLKLKKYFKKIYGAEDFDDKAEFIKQYIKKNKLKPENCYYIGDRAKDVEVARESGCKSIIIFGKCSWDSKKEIIKQHPDFLVHSLKDINKILK